MTSKLFQKLVQLPGVSIFNWKEKVGYTKPPERVEPLVDHGYSYLHKLAHKYFVQLIAQDRYIKTLNRILDGYLFEVEKWDAIQNKHEQELISVRGEYNNKFSSKYVAELEKQIANLREKLDRQTKHLNMLNEQNKAAKYDKKVERKQNRAPIVDDGAKAELIKLRRDNESLAERLKVQHRLNELLVKQNKKV